MNLNNHDRSIESTVIASLLLNESYLYEEAFIIDEAYFVLPFHKMLVKRIREGIEKGESLSLLNIKLDAYIRDVKFEYEKEWINIIASMPLSMKIAHQYYEDIKVKHKIRKIR